MSGTEVSQRGMAPSYPIPHSAFRTPHYFVTDHSSAFQTKWVG